MTEEIKNQTENNGAETIKNNSEILFIYDATMCNPNGDPDDENKPRMDYDRNINLVSDLRLKRYIRDYLMNYRGKTIFVCKVDGETVDATGRLKYLYLLSNIVSALDDEGKLDDTKLDEDVKKVLKEKTEDEQVRRERLEEFVVSLKNDQKNLRDINNYKGLSKKLNIKLSGKSSELKKIKDTNIAKLSDDVLLSKLVDVRYFGATMPIKSEEGTGSSRTFTGPIQFNWGYSLNKVEGPMLSNGITATFGGATDEYGGMGKDYRVDYSIIAFHGIISAKRAEHTCLKDEDITLFDEAMIKAIPLEATTRSKKGQTPLLYLRIEYVNNEFFFSDLRKYVKLTDSKGNEIDFDKIKLSSTKDYELDLSKMKEKLEYHKDKIKDIHFWKQQDLETSGFNELKNGGKLEVKYKENGEEKMREIKFIELLT